MSSARAGTGTPTSPSGTIDPALLLGVVRAAGATAICETPDEDGGLAADVSWLQQHLRAATRPAEPDPEPVRGLVQDAPGRVIEAVGTHHVPFGKKNVPHHVGGEQGYGEEPGQQQRRSTSRC